MLGASIAATTSSVIPAFLAGAVGVQLRADLAMTEAGLGVALAGFFATAALGSVLLGRIAERLGASAAMRMGLTLSAVTMLAVAAGGRSPLTFTAILAAGGLANALTQPSANLLLAERLSPRRLGFGMALKQAGMPMATLLGGAAVPSLALTVGWRWAYVAAALLALAAMTVVPSGTSRRPKRTTPRPPPARPDQSMHLLVLLSVSSCLGAAVAGALTAFLVSGAEASGVSPGLAGLLLSAGSALGIASRLTHGLLADRGRVDPLPRVTVLFALGAIGLGLFGLTTPVSYVVGTVLAFAFGWSWPGLFNLAIVLANPSAPAAATGVTQTGVYIGALAGPLLFGIAVTRFDYGVAWMGCALALLAASAALMVGRRQLRIAAPSAH